MQTGNIALCGFSIGLVAIATLSSSPGSRAQGRPPGSGPPPGVGGGVAAEIAQISAKLDEVLELTRPAPSASVTFCFKADGGLKAELEAAAEGKGDLSGKVGADVYGSGAGAKATAKGGVEGKLKGDFTIALVEFTFCIDIPIALPFLDGAGRSGGVPDPLVAFITALEQGGSGVRDQICAVAGQLGWSSDVLTDRIMGALGELTTCDVGTQPLSILCNLPGQLQQLSEALPMNQNLRNGIQNLSQNIPTSLSQLDFCSPDFMFEIPPEVEPIVDTACSLGEQAKEVFENLTSTVQGIVQNLMNFFNNFFCGLFPLACD